MWHSIVRRVIDICSRGDFEYAELQGSLVELISSVCFFLGGLSVDLLPRRIQIAWGCAFLIVGLSQMVGLVRLNYAVRRVASFSAVCLWISVASLFGGDWEPFLAALAFAFAFGSAWGYVRIGRHHAIREALHNHIHSARLPQRG